MAPNGNHASLSTGATLAPADLHIALVIPQKKMWDYLKDRIFLIQPPYWKGNVILHLIPDNPKSRWNDIDWQIRQALVDSGLANPDQVEFSPPVELQFGWSK